MVLFKRLNAARRTKALKRVTFEAGTNVNHVDLHENTEDIWYSKEDLVKFKHRDQHIVNQLTQKTNNPRCLLERKMLLEESPRGLEYAQPGKLKLQNRRQMNSIASVLNIQRVFKGLSTSEDTSSGETGPSVLTPIGDRYSSIECSSPNFGWKIWN